MQAEEQSATKGDALLEIGQTAARELLSLLLFLGSILLPTQNPRRSAARRAEAQLSMIGRSAQKRANRAVRGTGAVGWYRGVGVYWDFI